MAHPRTQKDYHEMVSLGIDIAGAANRHFDLALVEWGESFNSNSNVFWHRMPLGVKNVDYPSYDKEAIREATASGNLEEISHLSFTIIDHLSERLSKSLHKLNIKCNNIDIIAIDSPSGFSRNYIGHGRATEKVWGRFVINMDYNKFGVNFQMSPSIKCGRERGNDWFWIIFGMAAFHLLDNNFTSNIDLWFNFLRDGIINRDRIIEIFPRVSIQYLRIQHNITIEAIQKVVNNIQNTNNESILIKRALNDGQRTGNDRADALIAALTTLPFVFPGYFESIPLMHNNPKNYQSIDNIPWDKEGLIYAFNVINNRL